MIVREGSITNDRLCQCNNTAGYFDKDESKKGLLCETTTCDAGQEARLQGLYTGPLLLLKVKCTFNYGS